MRRRKYSVQELAIGLAISMIALALLEFWQGRANHSVDTLPVILLGIGAGILVIVGVIVAGQLEERRLRALKLADVDNMGGLEFEHYVGRLFEHQGFKVNVTRGSGDLGVDIVARSAAHSYAVQVKRFKTRISRRAVSDAVAGKAHYGCDSAMVVTNSYFTKGAKDLATSTGCELVDRDILADWITDYTSAPQHAN